MALSHNIASPCNLYRPLYVPTITVVTITPDVYVNISFNPLDIWEREHSFSIVRKVTRALRFYRLVKTIDCDVAIVKSNIIPPHAWRQGLSLYIPVKLAIQRRKGYMTEVVLWVLINRGYLEPWNDAMDQKYSRLTPSKLKGEPYVTPVDVCDNPRGSSSDFLTFIVISRKVVGYCMGCWRCSDASLCWGSLILLRVTAMYFISRDGTVLDLCNRLVLIDIIVEWLQSPTLSLHRYSLLLSTRWRRCRC